MHIVIHIIGNRGPQILGAHCLVCFVDDPHGSLLSLRENQFLNGSSRQRIIPKMLIYVNLQTWSCQNKNKPDAMIMGDERGVGKPRLGARRKRRNVSEKSRAVEHIVLPAGAESCRKRSRTFCCSARRGTGQHTDDRRSRRSRCAARRTNGRDREARRSKCDRAEGASESLVLERKF